MRLANKVVLITGAASPRGMGFAAARRFAAEGAAVMLTDIDEPPVAEAAARIRAEGGNAASFKLDVASEPAWRDALRATVQNFGKLHILVNNAGVALFPPAPWRISTAWWRSICAAPSSAPARRWR
jgi:NAD(P)-dependent dehydrogenase (short-subunit alcohol dehydrogenase family)